MFPDYNNSPDAFLTWCLFAVNLLKLNPIEYDIKDGGWWSNDRFAISYTTPKLVIPTLQIKSPKGENYNRISTIPTNVFRGNIVRYKAELAKYAQQPFLDFSESILITAIARYYPTPKQVSWL